MKINKIALIGILAAFICLLSPLSIPFGTIPISLATFAIYIIACIVSVRISLSAVIIYILLGAVGLPVFSFFRGGLHMITGITGGYIIGYAFCAVIISLLVGKFESQKIIYPISMISGTVVCYLTGILWYMFQTGSGFISSLTVCVLPFLIGDFIKISAASAVGFTLRKRLAKFTRS